VFQTNGFQPFCAILSIPSFPLHSFFPSNNGSSAIVLAVACATYSEISPSRSSPSDSTHLRKDSDINHPASSTLGDEPADARRTSHRASQCAFLTNTNTLSNHTAWALTIDLLFLLRQTSPTLRLQMSEPISPPAPTRLPSQFPTMAVRFTFPNLVATAVCHKPLYSSNTTKVESHQSRAMEDQV